MVEFHGGIHSKNVSLVFYLFIHQMTLGGRYSAHRRQRRPAMNVLLLQPPNAHLAYVARFSITEPLTGLFLGPVLRAAGHDVRLVDMRITSQLERELGPDFEVLNAAIEPKIAPTTSAVITPNARPCSPTA